MDIGAIMNDRFKKKINIGDWVVYWHKREGFSRPDIAEVVEITKVPYTSRSFAKIRYTSPHKQICYCDRNASGITLLTNEEAMLKILEKVTE